MAVEKENRRLKKSERAALIKARNKERAFAKLNNYPSSPRKMRLVADAIRGVEVNRALDILKFSTKHAAAPLRTLLLSAIDNWQTKMGDSADIDETTLVVSEIEVGGGKMLKRLQTAPQGRAHRIRKRSHHVTLSIVEKK